MNPSFLLQYSRGNVTLTIVDNFDTVMFFPLISPSIFSHRQEAAERGSLVSGSVVVVDGYRYERQFPRLKRRALPSLFTSSYVNSLHQAVLLCTSRRLITRNYLNPLPDILATSSSFFLHFLKIIPAACSSCD